MALFACQNLSLGYEGRVILQNLSFSLEEGDFLCIVGENGAGKSTLMRTMLGLQSPLQGQLMMGDGWRPREIGYLPQQTPIQKDFPASVWEIVLSGCQGRCGLRSFYNGTEKRLAEQAMEKLGITSLKKRCYRELSGGQQQRVLLARALCAARKVLLLDEPVAGLDPKVTADMYRLIRELNERDGITILMITHDVSVALQGASHVLHLGNPSFFGTTQEYLQSDVGRPFGKKEEVTEHDA